MAFQPHNSKSAYVMNHHVSVTNRFACSCKERDKSNSCDCKGAAI